MCVSQEQCTGLGTQGLNESHTTTSVSIVFAPPWFTLRAGDNQFCHFCHRSSARDRDQYKSSTVCRLHSLQILLTKSRMARFLLCCLVASILVASHLANALPQELVVGSACQLEVLSLCQFLIDSLSKIDALFNFQLKPCSIFAFHRQFVICPGDHLRRADRRKKSGRMQQMLAQAGLGGQVGRFQKDRKHFTQIL